MDHRPARLLDGRRAAAILELIACLLPQAVAISIPLGLVAGVICGWRDASDRARSRRVILATTLAWTAVGIANVGWLTPIANQRYRVVAFGQPLAPGANELTLVELGRRAQIEKFDPAFAAARLAPEPFPLALYYHMRLAVAASPLVLIGFAVTAAGIRRRYLRRATTTAGIALFLCCYVLFGPEPIRLALRWLSPAVVPWIPNATVLAFTLATMTMIWLAAQSVEPERRP